MAKSTYFSSKFVFGQLISLIDDAMIKKKLKSVIQIVIQSDLQQKIT